MVGLLYKDFVAIKGRIYLIFLSLGMVLTVLLRMALHFEGIDLIIFTLYFCFTMILFLFLVNKIETAIIATDEGRKRKNYCLGLPISKQTYVASKYIFLLIGFFVVMSMLILLGSFCRIGCEDKVMEGNIIQLIGLVPSLACIMLFISSIELPFFIGFGSKKGAYLKTGLLIACFFLIIVYLMFGNLDIFDQISIINLFNYLEKHPDIALTCQVFIPYCSLGLYYVSYRISCLLFLRREWEND